MKQPAGATQEPMLDAADVARWLKCSRAHVYRCAFRARDPLPSFLFGGARRFDRREVTGWIARQRDGGAGIGIELVDVEV